MKQYAMDDYDFIYEKLKELTKSNGPEELKANYIDKLKEKYITDNSSPRIMADEDREVVANYYQCKWIGYKMTGRCQRNTSYACLKHDKCCATA